MAPMAEADCSGRRRFAVACSVLSQCVRADAAAGKTVPPRRARSVAQAAAQPASTMLLMPGAEVTGEETAVATAAAQLTVMYGGRVLVFDDVPADRAAAVMRIARQADVLDGPADLQVARKASLQRLMEKRRDRRGERAPYAPARLAVVPPIRGQEEGDVGTCLELGLPGGCAP